MADSSILPQINEADLKGPCYRLNQNLAVIFDLSREARSIARQTITAIGSSVVLRGTHAERLTLSSVTEGTLFVEVDRNQLVYQWQYGGWKYVSGTYQVVQSAIAALVATLETEDENLLLEVTDFGHVLQWSGTALGWGPGEPGSGMIQAFAVDPSPTTGWKFCDGSATTYLKADGTTGNFTPPDLTSAANKAAYLKMAGTVAGPTAAAAPTLTNPTVANASTGVTANSNTTGVTVNSGAAAIGADNGAGQVVAAGVGTTVAAHTHTHTDAGHTHGVADAGHTHGVTDPQHTHALTGGSVAADGEPRHYDLRPWFRR